jgi:hypothetical protein
MPSLAQKEANTMSKAILSFGWGVFSLVLSSAVILVYGLPLVDPFVFSVVVGIPPLVVGVLALREIKRSAGRLGGKGLAYMGMTAAVVGMIAPPVTGVLLYRAASKLQSTNNLKELALATMYYHMKENHLPPPVLRSPSGHDVSWRVELLPYLGEDELYKQYRKDEPWDGPNNRLLLARMPRVYAPPAPPGMPPGESTFYQMVVGPGSDARSKRHRESPAGTADTLLFVEAATAVPWTKPEDVTYSPDQPLPAFGGIFPSGFHVAFTDGTVKWIEKEKASQVGEWLPRTWSPAR